MNEPDNGVTSNEVIKTLIYNSKLYEESGGKEFTSTWLTFPATEEDVKTALNEIGVDGKNYSRYKIDERDSDIKGLGDCLPENADIDEINYLAVKLQGIDEHGREILEAVIHASGYSLTAAQLINAADNVDCYDLQPAVSPEDYGDFLINLLLDKIATVSMEHFSGQGDASRLFLKDIDKLEGFVDKKRYGQAAAEAEGGSFTDFGYITKTSEPTERYKDKTDIPAEYRVFAYPDDGPRAGLFKIENTDLTAFVYKLHVLAGDYTNSVQHNMGILTESAAEDYIILIDSQKIRITVTETAYQDHTDIYAAFGLLARDTRAYMLHADSREDGRVLGTAVMADSGVLANDIAHDTQNIGEHIAALFTGLSSEAEAITPDTMLDYLNAEYMAKASYSQPGMLRIPQEAAKNLLLHEDAGVYRLMPRAPEKLSIITAAKNGLNFQNFREFAIKKDERAGLDRLCGRDIGKPLQAREINRQKRDKSGQDL